MNSGFYVIVFIYSVNCEWVEITPIENKKYLSGNKNQYRTTTENYENIMKSPFMKTETVTPAYLSGQQNLANFTDSTEGITIEVNDVTEISSNFNDFSNANDDSPVYEKKDADTTEEFLPFLKTIQKSLLKYKKSHKSKLSVLKQLRDHLVINIKTLITNLWKPRTTLEARGYHEEENHMDFPSNEGALMTIGFLTFAVFLIKLVIKLVHTLKYKQQLYGMTSTTTAASVVFLKRRKRDEQEEEMTRILRYIEEF